MPLVATAPDQAQLPLAVHEVAFVLDQVRVELPPETIVDGLSATATVGLPDAVTVTVAFAGVEPPVPAQVRV